MRVFVATLAAAVALSGCALLTDIVETIPPGMIVVEPGDGSGSASSGTPGADGRAAGPMPLPEGVGDPHNPNVPDGLEARSAEMVTPEMLSLAASVARRATRDTQGARSFDAKRDAVGGFRLTEEEERRASVLGFRTITVEVSGGGNSPYAIGGSVAQGVAFGLGSDEPVRPITSAGISVAPPGAALSLQIGFWTTHIDEMAGWSVGVSAGYTAPRGLGGVAGVYWSAGLPPLTWEGFSVGATAGPPPPKSPVSAEASLAWTDYTDQWVRTAKDGFNFFTGQPTQYGSEIDGRCTVGTDCQGYTLPGSRQPGTACCGGSCQRTKKDYAGLNWCPAACKKSLLAPPGSC